MLTAAVLFLWIGWSVRVYLIVSLFITVVVGHGIVTKIISEDGYLQWGEIKWIRKWVQILLNWITYIWKKSMEMGPRTSRLNLTLSPGGAFQWGSFSVDTDEVIFLMSADRTLLLLLTDCCSDTLKLGGLEQAEGDRDRGTYAVMRDGLCYQREWNYWKEVVKRNTYSM